LTGRGGADSFDCGPGKDTITDFDAAEGDTKTADCENFSSNESASNDNATIGTPSSPGKERVGNFPTTEEDASSGPPTTTTTTTTTTTSSSNETEAATATAEIMPVLPDEEEQQQQQNQNSAITTTPTRPRYEEDIFN
jgi:hypothetical protein